MKISRTVPDHEIEIPDREAIGQEYWDSMTAGDTSDIDAQARLQKAEKDSITDMKISDTEIKLEVNKVKKYFEKLRDELIEYVVKKFLSPEKVGELLENVISFIIDGIRSLIELLKKKAAETETNLDDVAIKAFADAFEKLAGKENKPE